MSPPCGTVLITGADGFIGRHAAFALCAAGWKVIACARRTARLERMGFDMLEADLTAHYRFGPYRSGPQHGQALLKRATCVINAAGVLNATDQVALAVHVETPEASRACAIRVSLGWPAFATLAGIFWFMVSKPQLW